jgi:hypothetical protein
MVEFTVSIDDNVLEVLEILAHLKGVTVEEYLRGMLLEDIARIQRRLNDPMVGAISSGRSDVSERDEEILYNEWEPD